MLPLSLVRISLVFTHLVESGYAFWSRVTIMSSTTGYNFRAITTNPLGAVLNEPPEAGPRIPNLSK